MPVSFPVYMLPRFHLCVTICHFLRSEKHPPTLTGLIVPWHVAFLDICDHAARRRPDEYERRQGGGVKEQRRGTAASGCQSALAAATGLTDGSKTENGPPTGKRSYCTLAGRIEFSFPILFPLPPFLCKLLGLFLLFLSR